MKTNFRQNLITAALMCASLVLPAFAEEFAAEPGNVNKQEKSYSPGAFTANP